MRSSPTSAMKAPRVAPGRSAHATLGLVARSNQSPGVPGRGRRGRTAHRLRGLLELRLDWGGESTVNLHGLVLPPEAHQRVSDHFFSLRLLSTAFSIKCTPLAPS